MPIFQSDGTTQMTVQSDTFFCFGFGYVAQRLADEVMDTNTVVYGTSRSPEKAVEIENSRRNTIGVIFDQSANRLRPPNGAHWIISIPPDLNGCPAFAAAADFAATASSITYLSSTGVYGDRDGDWVFENTPTAPQSPRAERRVIAENQWKRVGANIVRLPGIYGPERSAVDRLIAGTARRIIKERQVFSRVHLDDIVSGLLAISKYEKRRYVFHFCDDEPAPPQDVILHAARLLRMPPPEEVKLEDAGLSEMARSFYSECKRVSNVATKLALGWEPKYPTYREGLSAIVSSEGLMPAD